MIICWVYHSKTEEMLHKSYNQFHHTKIKATDRTKQHILFFKAVIHFCVMIITTNICYSNVYIFYCNLGLTIKFIIFRLSMNLSEDSQLKLSEDAMIAQKAAEFFKLIQSKIALKSFEGARQILFCTYSTTLLGEDSVSYLKTKIDEAESNYKKDGNRFYWEWRVIFVVSTLSAGYLIWKYGMVQRILSLLRTSSFIAKAIIGGAVYTTAAAIGGTFTYLCKIIKDLVVKIFG